jgi:lipoprotein-releasing system permease protein
MAGEERGAPGSSPDVIRRTETAWIAHVQVPPCEPLSANRFIALASIISVTLGVATMIVVNSVMSGFSYQMKDRIRGILADVLVETTSTDGTWDPDLLMDQVNAAAGHYIESMTPTVEIYGMMSFYWAGQTVYRPVTLIGIVPDGKDSVSPLRHYLLSRQELMDNDVVVRPPLRPLDAPLDWSLTEEAQSARAEWIERQQFLREFDHEYGAGIVPEPDPHVQQALAIGESVSDEATNVLDAPGPHERPRTAPASEFDDPFALAGAEAGSTADDPDRPAPPALHDPFAGSMPDLPPTDPTLPLSGRVFVGAGLVSFPYQDSETGKTHLMYMVQPGQDINLTTIKTGQPQPATFKATVVDVFKSGMSEYDSNLVFCNLEELQYARGMLTGPDPTRPRENLDWKNGAITTLQIKLKDYKDAPEVLRRLRSELDHNFQVRTWEQKQGPLLEAVAVESAILNVLLFLIITVAGFGILAIFYMIVVEKTRDIGILKALGASSRGVMTIFLSYGLALGIVGSGGGVILGLLFVRYINQIESVLSWITGRKVFDETIYYFHEIPTVVHPMMVAWVALGAMIIAVLASVLPARRAARLHPVQALRYE